MAGGEAAARLRLNRFPPGTTAESLLCRAADGFRRASGGERDGEVSVLPGRWEISAARRGLRRRRWPYCSSGPRPGADSGGDSVPEPRREYFLSDIRADRL